MAKQKPYVRIQSTKTINVTCGLQNMDVTNKDAHIPDRLKVSALWPKCAVKIEVGAHYYPSEIVEWPTVKALERDKIITIGELVDTIADETESANVETTKDKLASELAKMNTKIKANNNVETKANEQTSDTIKLSDLAGE